MDVQLQVFWTENVTDLIIIFNKWLCIHFKQYDGSSGLWEDEETRIFYENLRDLKAFLPGVIKLNTVQL